MFYKTSCMICGSFVTLESIPMGYECPICKAKVDISKGGWLKAKDWNGFKPPKKVVKETKPKKGKKGNDYMDLFSFL